MFPVHLRSFLSVPSPPSSSSLIFSIFSPVHFHSFFSFHLHLLQLLVSVLIVNFFFFFFLFPLNGLHHKVLTYIEYRAVSGVFRTIDSPPPLHPASVSSPRSKGGGVGWGGTVHTRRAVRSWGSIFRKTPNIGLASYCIISLRAALSLSLFRRRIPLPIAPACHPSLVSPQGKG